MERSLDTQKALERGARGGEEREITQLPGRDAHECRVTRREAEVGRGWGGGRAGPLVSRRVDLSYVHPSPHCQ